MAADSIKSITVNLNCVFLSLKFEERELPNLY